MDNESYKDLLETITETLLPRFLEAKIEMGENPMDDFVCGRAEAYYEILDTIKNRIVMYGYDPAEFGLTDEVIKP